jgi:hypothetical protein
MYAEVFDRLAIFEAYKAVDDKLNSFRHYSLQPLRPNVLEILRGTQEAVAVISPTTIYSGFPIIEIAGS